MHSAEFSGAEMLDQEVRSNKMIPHGCEDGRPTGRYLAPMNMLLIVLAFSTLIAKRHHEREKLRRPWQIWFWDVSKQIIGTFFIQSFSYVLPALIGEDPCTVYVINCLVDVTLGMSFIWLAVELVCVLVKHMQWTVLMFGEYGDPTLTPWIAQLAVYLLIILLEKVMVALFTLLPGMSKLQASLLSYITDPQLERDLVMVMLPYINYVVMYWVVDSLMMRRKAWRVKRPIPHAG